LLIIMVAGLVSHSSIRAQSTGGTASGTAGGTAGGTVFSGQTGTATRPVAPGNVTVLQPKNAAMQPQQVLQQQQALQQQAVQQQQALQQQQMQQAQQAAAGAQQRTGAASGSQQASQPGNSLVPNASQIGPAAQPPQVGVATSISAAPGQAAQAPSPGTVPQNANGTTTPTGAAQSNATLANGGLQTLGTNGPGAIVPATVGTLAGVPVVGVPNAAGQNVQTNTNSTLAVQPNANAASQVLVPVTRPAKPALAMDDLPDAVQKVLKGELGSGSLYTLEQTSSNLGIAYKAGFKSGNDDTQKKIRIIIPK